MKKEVVHYSCYQLIKKGFAKSSEKMGIRGIIENIAGIYLGFEIIRGYITHNFTVTSSILIAGSVLLIFGLWFLLERIGIIPKVT